LNQRIAWRSRSDLKRRRALEAAGKAGASDYVSDLLKRAEAQRDAVAQKSPEEVERELRELAAPSQYSKIALDVSRFAGIRIFFDCHLPLFVGAAAIATVLFETRGFPGWQYVTPVLGTILVVISIIYLVKNWHHITRWLALQRHHWYRWRSRRIAERLKKLSSSSGKQKRLQTKYQEILEQVLRGPWV
jgi:hypothetical protein